MAKQQTTTEDAEQAMINFISEHLGGVDKIRQEGNSFHATQDGIEVVVRALANPTKPSDKYVKEVIEKSKKGVYTGLILVRSTTYYEGPFLKQAEYSKGEGSPNLYYTNKKKLTVFEQKVVDLFGSPLPYFNPSENLIQLIRLPKYRRIPEHLQIPEGSDGSDQPKEVRKERHFYEGLRKRVRKISIAGEIEGSFTLRRYERKGRKLVRIVPYTPDQKQ